MHLPWGSLLRGVAGHDDAVLAGAAALLAPGAAFTALISITPRDGVPEPASRAALDAAYARCGLALEEVRPATRAEVAASRSSWARRLGAGAGRPVTLLRARRDGGPTQVPRR